MLGWQLTEACQDAGAAGMLVGSLLLVLYPHEPASPEYLIVPELYLYGISAWPCFLSVSMWFLSFSHDTQTDSLFLPVWLIHGRQKNKRKPFLLFITGEKLYVLWANPRGKLSCFYDCMCIIMGTNYPGTGFWTPRWPVYASVGFAILDTGVELGWETLQGEISLFSGDSLASAD